MYGPDRGTKRVFKKRIGKNEILITFCGRFIDFMIKNDDFSDAYTFVNKEEELRVIEGVLDVIREGNVEDIYRFIVPGAGPMKLVVREVRQKSYFFTYLGKKYFKGSMRYYDEYVKYERVPFLEGVYNVYVPYGVPAGVIDAFSIDDLPENVKAYRLRGAWNNIVPVKSEKIDEIYLVDELLILRGNEFIISFNTVHQKYIIKIKNPEKIITLDPNEFAGISDHIDDLLETVVTLY